ncbi:MAG: CHAT domain-containing protein, partial [Pyrinomonadaceae bacterium]|nr:CHAT domain-containing protein [Pyrinomonadaceae bacterium]
QAFYTKGNNARLNRNDSGLNNFQDAISIYKSLPQTKPVKYRLFLTYYYLALYLSYVKKPEEAIPYFEKSLVLANEVTDKYIEALALKGLGEAYLHTKNFARSNEILTNAIINLEKLIQEKMGEIHTLPSTYIAQSETFLKLNNPEKSIELLEIVRQNHQNSPTEYHLASIKLADILLDLGNQKKAEDIISSLNISNNLSNYVKGVFYKVSGKLFMKTNKNEALALFEKAAVFLKNNEQESAEIKLFIGNTYFYANDFSSAKPIFEETKISFEKFNDQFNLAQSINNLGVINFHQKELQLAISNCENALIINIKIQADLNLVSNLINLMYFYENSGKQDLAIFYGKWAINTIQSIKYEQLSGLESEIKNTFQDSFTDTFRKLSNLLINESRISEAEQVLRFIKEKEYQDYVRGGTQFIQIDFNQKEEELLKQLNGRNPKRNLIITENSRLPKFESPTINLINKFKAQKIDISKTIFVSTLVNKEEIVVFAHNEKKQKVYSVKVKREDLNKTIFEFRKSLTDLNSNPKIAGKTLYDLLIKPLETDFLSNNPNKIVWSLDGVLRYIPISALFDGKDYLVNRFANIQVNLAVDKKILVDKNIGNSAVGLASSKAFENLSSLPTAKNELDCIFEDEKKLIINSTCEKGLIKGKKFADDDFTRDVFEDALRKYRLIHLTSHFVIQTGDNSKSFLLLGGGENRKYTMQSFAKQNLENVETLVMSACDTANFSSDGSEFESFATMAQKQGAKTVIATLWTVADVSTSKFMKEYYRVYNFENLDKSESLQKAQLALYRSKKYSHPFYWSPFVLFGNWQ